MLVCSKNGWRSCKPKLFKQHSETRSGSFGISGRFAVEKVGDFVEVRSTMEKKIFHGVSVHHSVPSGTVNYDRGFLFSVKRGPKTHMQIMFKLFENN